MVPVPAFGNEIGEFKKICKKFYISFRTFSLRKFFKLFADGGFDLLPSPDPDQKP